MTFRLDNGLEVVLEENHAAPVVAFQAWVKVGSADEPPELAGIAHVFEHMLFKGTKKRGVGQIAQEVESAGGEINAWTSYDETVYHLVLAGDFFDTGLDILADTLTSSSFDAQEFERERNVVLEEIKQGLDDPDRVAAQSLFQAAFDVHPYGRPIIGSEATVRRMRRDDLLSFFNRHYVARNVTLVVVGDFDTAVAKEKITAAFRGMAAGSPAPARAAQPAQTALRLQASGRDVKETQLLFGFRTPAIGHADIPALDLLAVILGQGDSSRLNLEVVRNRQLATTASSYVFSARDPGLLVVGVSMPPGRIDEASRAVLDEILRLGREEVGAQELAKARTMLESDRIYDKETVQGYARKLGFFSAIAGDISFEERYFERLQKITAADLKRVAGTYLRVGNLTAFAQVPEARVDRQKEKAEKTGAKLRAVAEAAEARATARHARAAATPASSDKVVRHVFPSGLKLLVMRDVSVPIVAVRATWVGGLRYEDARSNGISNMVASLLTRGTKSRSAEQIMTEVESMAGNLSGYSGRNSLGVQAEFLARHWERGLELLADCLLNASFSEDELEKERRIVLDDLRAQEDNLGQVAFHLFHGAMWKRHPYRLDPLGSADSVASLTRRKLLTHFRHHYGVGNLTLAVVGDVEAEAVIAKIGSLFAGASDDELEPLTVPVDPAATEPAQVARILSKEQAHVVVGFRGTSFDNPDRFALELLAQVLSGQGGRLFVEIREKRALAYRVSAFSMEGIDPGYFAVYVATSPENLEEAQKAIRDELRSVVDKGISPAELARAQRYLVGTHAIGLQRKSAIAAALAFHEAYGQGWKAYRQYNDSIMKVKAQDVARVARKYLDPQREVAAVVRPSAPAPAATARAAAARAGAAAPARTTTP
ncbi:MAG TPA: pitrilysin family protein [Polyangia bacterium]|nr:pitrilysin family protein [Polyangia bacterium]